MMRGTYKGWLVAILFATGFSQAHAQESQVAVPPLEKTQVVSRADGHQQPVRYWAPQSAKQQRTPLLILLHTWGGDVNQKHDDWQAEAVQRGWLYIQPNFRGPNKRPEALGSKLARQDILDAIDFMQREFKVDGRRVYLAGVSGGGHMTMLMAGHHPEKFSAASAWVGISDIAEWHRFHVKDGKPDNYAQNIVDSLGGPPGEIPERDAEYRDRSPVNWLHRATELPLDIAAGVFDGHKGSVPVSHSLAAFNAVAKANGTPLISTAEMTQLWEAGRQTEPPAVDCVDDPSFGRRVLLRRVSKQSRVSIFQGGHEGLPHAACEWLAQQHRATH